MCQNAHHQNRQHYDFLLLVHSASQLLIRQKQCSVSYLCAFFVHLPTEILWKIAGAITCTYTDHMYKLGSHVHVLITCRYTNPNVRVMRQGLCLGVLVLWVGHILICQ